MMTSDMITSLTTAAKKVSLILSSLVLLSMPYKSFAGTWTVSVDSVTTDIYENSSSYSSSGNDFYYGVSNTANSMLSPYESDGHVSGHVTYRFTWTPSYVGETVPFVNGAVGAVVKMRYDYNIFSYEDDPDDALNGTVAHTECRLGYDGNVKIFNAYMTAVPGHASHGEVTGTNGWVTERTTEPYSASNMTQVGTTWQGTCNVPFSVVGYAGVFGYSGNAQVYFTGLMRVVQVESQTVAANP